LCQTLGRRRCLQVLVGDVQAAVTQVVANGEPMLSHGGQNASYRMPTGMPAHACDSKFDDAGLIFRFSSEARSSGFRAFLRSDRNTKSVSAAVQENLFYLRERESACSIARFTSATFPSFKKDRANPLDI
jgi:hypothetical protein